MAKKNVLEKKKDFSWLTIRLDEGLREKLDRWKEKFRRTSRSDAARMILEDRLNADGIK